MEPNKIFVTDDTMYNILMESSYEDVTRLCSLAKNASMICNQPNFWKDKFEHDNLIVMNNEPNNWKAEYKKVYNAMYLTEKVIRLAHNKSFLLNKPTNINFRFKNKDYTLVLPKSLLNKINSYLKDSNLSNSDNIDITLIITNENNTISDKISLSFLIEDDNDDDHLETSSVINYDTLYDTIFKIFYYYPDINVYDDIEYFKGKKYF